MGILKKRSTAILALIVVILLGTLLGVHLSVNRETAKIEEQFYKGVYLKSEKYTQPGIQLQLDKREKAALGLGAVAANYSDLAALSEALNSARRELISTPSIPEKFEANEKMQAAYEKLYPALMQQPLNDNEKAAVASYAETLDGAQGIIDKSDYNRLVGDFRGKTLKAFPVNILSKLAFVDYPQYFGALS